MYPINEAEGTSVMHAQDSHSETLDRFSAASVASKYPSEFRQGHWRDERERRCILNALKHVPHDAHVLDLPCGTGRVTRLLQERGYQVTAADSSEEMLALAERNGTMRRSGCGDATVPVTYHASDVLSSGFCDGQFDAVVCHRLFHHFRESETRKAAMRELCRISRGPVIMSFFNSFSLTAWIRRGRHIFSRRPIRDRVSVSMSLFLAELEAAGLSPLRTFAATWGISPMWLVVAVPACCVTERVDATVEPHVESLLCAPMGPSGVAANLTAAGVRSRAKADAERCRVVT